MRIKEISDATAVPVDTIRHYEKAGLLGAPRRGDNNYRRFEASDAQRLRFIRNCRALDMSLDEVRVLLDFIDHPGSDCSPVDAVVDGHLAHVRERLAALRVLEQQLKTLRSACGHPMPHAACGIVLALSSEVPPIPRARGGVHGR